ncbi:MAG: hypothetical protein ACLSG7_05450 [Clostridia bacterium]
MINNQKRKNKKLVKQIIFIILIIVLIVILFFLFNHIYNQLRKKKEFENEILSFSEKNEETVFSINKIIFFSSCDSKNKTSSQTNFTIENLYAYTDIAIFIDNGQKEISSENTLKNVKITNIKFTKQPELGTGNLYYKNVNNFAKSEIYENNKIENELQFETTSEDEVDLSKPVLYNNCANPITLSYVNQNIKTDYTMTDTQNPITYNGKLLKRCGVSVNSINTSISFDIEIQNNKKQKFRTTIYFDIPYEDEDKSINDGSIVVEKNMNFNFYRYE